MNKVEAIENHENICFCCLKDIKSVKRYSIYRSEYGSSFDNFYTYLQLCSGCTPEDIDLWFDEEPEMIEGYYAYYKYEGKIKELVNTFPLEGQELFWNRVAYGANAYNMSPQDWIDDKLGILPDEIYEEEYDMYSPRQIKAYKERFTTCEHPINVVYSDDSKGCWCPFGANGEYGQKTGYNISNTCYNCPHYKVRETPIKEMDDKTYNKYKYYIIGKQYEHLFQ